MGLIEIKESADPAVIAAVHEATVAVAYRPYFPDSPPPTRAELRGIWGERLADPTAVALVAYSSGRPVGAVMARADPEFPGEGQILGLHVVPSSWGQGIGGSLHDDALTVLRAGGHVVGGLWVIEANDRARGLYEHRGWALRPGVTKLAHAIPEVRYRRNLGVLL